MKKNLAFLAFTVLVFGFLNYAIIEKEALKENGELVYLELAPVDPRSLMQGDFMQLRFDVVSNFTPADVPLNGPSSWPSRGRVVIKLDGNNIGTGFHYFDGSKLAGDEKLFRYTDFHGRGLFDIFPRSFGQRIKIVPDTFFFQEGHAQYYNAARYGVFIFGENGDYILIGLADENWEIIIPLEE